MKAWTCWYCQRLNPDTAEMCQKPGCNGLRDSSKDRFRFLRAFPGEEQPYYMHEVRKRLAEK